MLVTLPWQLVSKHKIASKPRRGLVWVVVAVATLFILPEYLTPPYDVMFMSFGSATLLAVFLYLNPKPFRSRGGSLVPAFCLVAALWLLAVVSTVLSLIG